MRYLIALLGILFCTNIASAQNFCGFYVGLNAGGAWGDAHVKSTTSSAGGDDDYFTIGEVAQINGIGKRHLFPQWFIGGVQAGYNFQSRCNPFVFGIETDFSGTKLTKSYNKLVTDVDFPPSFDEVRQRIRVNWLYTLRARIGYSCNCFFPFITGGLAVAKIRYHQAFSDNFNTLFVPGFPDAIESVTKSRTSCGWTVGAGLEYAFSCRLSACLTYLYSHFGRFKSIGHLVDPASGETATFNNSAGLHLNVLRLGINWRFSAFR